MIVEHSGITFVSAFLPSLDSVHALAAGDYTYVSKTSANGGKSISIQLDGGGLGTVLADVVIPQSVQAIPIVGPTLVFAVSWVPTVLCLSCCYTCCFRHHDAKSE